MGTYDYIRRMTRAFPHLDGVDTPNEFDRTPDENHLAQQLDDIKRIATRTETRLCKLIVHLGANHILKD